MKINKFLIFTLVFISLALPGSCADYLYKKLPSGQTVIVKEIKDNPIVTINTWVKTGSINEDESNSGVAHFLEHLFFKGSKNVPPGEFDKILESKGAVTNAATSKDYTQFYITIPSKDFDLALKMHSDMLLNPLIPRNELEKERPVVIEEISRGLDNPTNLLYNNLFQTMYEENLHPYFRPVIGSKKVISTISREKILDFYDKWYTPGNMITIVAGDVDAEYAASQVEKAFKKDVVKHARRVYPQLKPIVEPVQSKIEAEVAQGYMAIGYRAPKFTNSKDTYALDILAIILGGSNSSILNTEIKEKKQLVNSIGASYSQYLEDGIFIISSSFVPNKLSSVKKEINDEIEKVKNGAITKEQVQKAKNMIRTSTSYSRESAANIANELGFFTLYYGTPKMYDEYLKKINEVDVKDVILAANKYLDNKKTVTSLVMPKGFVEISDITSAAAAKITPDSATVLEKNDKETKYLLDNGAVFIVRQNKSNSIIAFDIYAKGGSYLAKTPGLAYLAAQNAKRGTRSFSHEELNNFLDDNGVNISLAANPDAFNISMLLTKNKLKEGLSVLDEIVNYPAFLTTEIDKTKKNYKEYVRSLKDRPLALAMDEFIGLAYPNYPYSNNNQKTLQYIDDITREDIESFYSCILDAKNLVITVVGDVDEPYMIKEMNKIFEDKSAAKVQVKDFMKTSYIPAENVISKVANPSKEQTWIILGYKICPIYDIKDMAAIRVIDSLLGSGMSSRLFRSLREEKGLAYQVGSQIQQYGNDGTFFAYIGTNSANESVASEAILSEFNKLKTEFVSEKELSEAKDKLLGNMIIGIETNMDRASLLSKYTVYEYDLNFLETLKKEIQNVTSSDILSFANKYFSNPYFKVIVGK